MTARTLTALLLLLPLAAQAQQSQEAETAEAPGYIAQVRGGDGAISGTVQVSPTASGMMLVRVVLNGVPPGMHGIHIHETGDCSAPDFSSAGGHVAGEASHGVRTEDGPHPGDLPNASAGADGRMATHAFNGLLAADDFEDADGAAFVLHSRADDYLTQPAGNAGDRIACGVFEKAGP